MVDGVGYVVIGIALLIYGFGIYDLVLSDLDSRYDGELEQHANLLSVSSLDSIKHELTNMFFQGRHYSDGKDTWQELICLK